MSKQQREPEKKASQVYLVKADAAQGIIEAVVNVFGIIDLGGDIIHNGAYTKTLNERGTGIKVRVLDSHNTDSVMRVVGLPLEVREIDRNELGQIAPEVLVDHPEATGGLFTRTQFLMDTHEGDGVYKRLASKAVDEWSIALNALQVEYGKARTPDGKDVTVRHIYQLRLYEYSPVIWGMNQATVTTDIKAEGARVTDNPVAADAKAATLDVRLIAYLRMEHAYLVNGWLSQGLILPTDADALDMAFRDMLATLSVALPDALVVAGIPSYYYHRPDPGDRKQATLGTKLEACVRSAFSYCVNYWLGEGTIDAVTADLMDEALKAALSVYRAALPAELAASPIVDSYYDYYSAPTPTEGKVGRMISGSNREQIQQCIDALQALMDASATEDTSDSADEPAQTDGKAVGEAPASPVTGPQPGAASIIELADIDREMTDLTLMMEMAR